MPPSLTLMNRDEKYLAFAIQAIDTEKGTRRQMNIFSTKFDVKTPSPLRFSSGHGNQPFKILGPQST